MGTFSPVLAPNSSGESTVVTENRERVATRPLSSLLTSALRQEDNDNDTCHVPVASQPVLGRNHISLRHNILMHDGWQLRPLSTPGGRMISWNVGLQGFWNVRTAISRLCSDTHPGIMLFQDLKVALSDRQKVIKACHKIAPFINPTSQGAVIHNILRVLAPFRC